ncbi:Uncharacterized membrane protein [Nitrosomonas cryotolerans]|uniref:Uncharacterized membrane protein n=1 Tax=Nitrosomonas cryotolerans ATCC 49181 TaxID=1131553 RepID=A0A1N6I124_9PROT|nr:BPSS1780 family membrane protein [Nitrosomonas cryotolerans]SFP58330.1 Uncharacterized membrane protein [Nitrosomonas cryotolerans]SIO25659.1 Uncharacterized membrane protein [Nitrosomonas cryotolerans ATCC 49181]
MEIRQVNAKQGWQWIISGFYLFRMAPAAWILAGFTLVLIAMTLALVPLLGKFIFTLISPVFLAGLMMGCKDLEQGKKLELLHLFLGFKKNVAPLITIGGIYLIGQVLIVGLVMLIGGTVMMDMLLYGKRVDENELMVVMDNMLTASLVALTLSIPLMMAAWFSPLLVIFNNTPPIVAMKKSFFACLRNFIPFQIYGITLIILTIFAVMPYGLGLIVLIPTVFASIYVSYKDIFLSEPLIIQDTPLKETSQKANWSDEPDSITKKGTESGTDQNIAINADQNEIQCTYCGLHLPKEKAVKINDQYFCSDEHRRQYESSTRE